jgi:oxygen-independent coproporphyrinogen-3 oxidase
MELPFNTRFSKQLFDGEMDVPPADWKTKREWHAYAFEELAKAGYEISSAYTMVKSPEARFVYRSALWEGSDMISLGVSSFGHMSGVHVQNTPQWDEYLSLIDGGELPVTRAFATTPEQRLTREVILQLKLGKIRPSYFNDKFGADILEQFAEPLNTLKQQGMLEIEDDLVRLTPQGLLRVDSLLPEFYAPEFQHARYT